VVVDGRLSAAEVVGNWVLFDIVVGEVLKGEPGSEITALLEVSPTIDATEYEQLLPEGARVIAFLYEHPQAPSGYALGVEGFYVDCPGTDTVGGVGPAWDRIATLNDLVVAVE
jgi:hypothetical protein